MSSMTFNISFYSLKPKTMAYLLVLIYQPLLLTSAISFFKQLAHDANLLRVPDIRWLGVFTSDFEEYCLPDCCLLHLSPEGE